MKLRNKKTGEIGEIGYIGSTDGSIDVNPINRVACETIASYNSLAELNEEWEDYEEPKEYWYMENNGDIDKETYDGDDYEERMKEIGNYFSSREEAEKAVEKLKAWKRLKDKGFSFDQVDRYEALCGNGFNIPITATMPPEAYIDAEVSKDIDLLFGGEE